MTTMRLENHSAHMLHLPPTEDFPQGVRLIPGLNTVPKKYLDQLEEKQVKTEARPGRPAGVRYPGKEALESLTKNKVTRYEWQGNWMTRSEGPALTIYSADQAPEGPDGPPPPESLPANPIGAKAVIAHCEDPRALRRWLKQTQAGNDPDDVRGAISAKLASLGSSRAPKSQE